MSLRCIFILCIVVILTNFIKGTPVKASKSFRISSSKINPGTWSDDFFATWSSDPEVITTTETPPTEDTTLSYLETATDDEEVFSTTENIIDPSTTPSTQEDESDEVDDSTYFEWIKSDSPEEFRTIHADYIEKYRDTTVNPCDNFYQYACGNWHKTYPNKGETCSHGAPALQRKRMEKLLSDFITSNLQSGDSEIFRKAKEFYASCMNVEEIDVRGIKPLIKFLTDLHSWPILNQDWSGDDFNWLTTIAKAELYGTDIFIQQYVTFNNSDYPEERYYAYLKCGNYVDSTEFVKGLEIYREFMTNNSYYLDLFGITMDYFDDMSTRMTEFNKKLFEISCSRVAETKIDFKTLRESVPRIDWQEYFSILLGRPMNPREVIVVSDLDYFVKLDQVIADTDPKTIADYIFSVLISNFAIYTDFKLKPEDRSRFCYRRVDFLMDNVLSHIFAKNLFNMHKQDDVLDILEDIRNTLKKTIESNKWLEKESKKEAIGKLNGIIASVGFTDFYTEEDLKKIYSDIDIDSNRFFENVVQLYRRRYQLRTALMGQNIDDGFNTQSVNARFSRFNTKDTIILPAGILQPPFYHEFAPRFMNYGSIGQTIGHEMLHAFDLIHGKFHSRGDSRMWYSEKDQQEISQHISCFSSQYDSENIVKLSEHEEAEAALSEKLSDAEGLKIAFGAYKKWSKDHPDFVKSELQDYARLNLTSAQLFYLVYAQNECSDLDNANSTIAIHQDGIFRVNGAVSNNGDFAKTFNCPAGAAMNPVRKCTFIF